MTHCTGRLPKFILPALLLAVSLAAVTPVSAFERRFYGGIGAGISLLDPEPNSTGFVLDDDQSTAFELRGGWDFSARWSLEAYYVSLGSASLSQGAGLNLSPSSGEIDYEAFGVSALAYFYNSQGATGLLARRGLSLFAGLGLGLLDTSSNLPIVQNESLQFVFTGGVEYGFTQGLAARFQITTYDSDAAALQLGLIYRFGDSGVPIVRNVGRTEEDASLEDETLFSETTVNEAGSGGSLLDTEVGQGDSDSDGVLDSQDVCPTTEPGSPVNATGCPVFEGRLDGLVFESASSELRSPARSILDELAAQLLLHPDVRVAVMAHTDNTGNAGSNLELSRERASAVASYLVSRGVSGQRLRAEAFGESRPVSSNQTAEGRRMNRRIELRVF